MDDLAGTIELQYFDGTVDEADSERWFSMQTQIAAAPEDWSGSVDIDNEDLPYIKQPLYHDWQSQLDLEDFSELPEEFD